MPALTPKGVLFAGARAEKVMLFCVTAVAANTIDDA